MRLGVLIKTVTSIEAEQESSSALLCILLDLLCDCSSQTESIIHSVAVYIVVALDLVRADAIGFDALLKLVSPLLGTRHVRILKFVSESTQIHSTALLCKLWQLSELAVAHVAEDEAYLIVGFEEATFHPGVVKDLGCSLDLDRD